MSADLDLPALFDAGSIASWLEAWIEVEHSSALTVRVPAEAEVRPIGAALLAAAVLALSDAELSERLAEWREKQTDSVAVHPKRGD